MFSAHPMYTGRPGTQSCISSMQCGQQMCSSFSYAAIAAKIEENLTLYIYIYLLGKWQIQTQKSCIYRYLAIFYGVLLVS